MAGLRRAVTRIVMGPDGVPLDHGRTVRLFPPHVRRAAEVRDGGCVFAGCGAPTWWCDVHHLLAWIDGGATDLDNLTYPQAIRWPAVYPCEARLLAIWQPSAS